MEGRDVPPPVGWNKPGNGQAGNDAAPPLPPIGGPATQT